MKSWAGAKSLLVVTCYERCASLYIPPSITKGVIGESGRLQPIILYPPTTPSLRLQGGRSSLTPDTFIFPLSVCAGVGRHDTNTSVVEDG